MEILIVEDDDEVASTIQELLMRYDYDVSHVSGGEEALEWLSEYTPALAILDIVMPGMTGLDLCRHIRADPRIGHIPILFLTAKGRASEIAEGLDAGGDDYLTKPYDVIELPARIRALLRRSQGILGDEAAQEVSVGSLTIHMSQPQVQVNEQLIKLTSTEHQLLCYLAAHPNKPISVDRLLESVWDYPPRTGNPNVVQVTIRRLRQKIETDPDDEQYIFNVWGKGYMISH